MRLDAVDLIASVGFADLIDADFTDADSTDVMPIHSLHITLHPPTVRSLANSAIQYGLVFCLRPSPRP